MRTYVTLLLSVALSLPMTACSEKSTGVDIEGVGTHKKEQVNIIGKVTCEGKGIANAVVSDGVEVVKTSDNGEYSFLSKKKYGYVFISIPSGYEAAIIGNQPQFFKHLATKDTNITEKVDFELNKENNEKHAVLAMADFHLAKRNNDINQFESVAADINQTAQELRSQGYKVYGISLGDESWDGFWYSNNYGIKETFQELQKIEIPFFHCMGNHDNDPYFPDDRKAEDEWIKNCGPVYYSFNAGNVHYIIIDDIQYLNAGASLGTVGKRNYNETVIPEELAWLKKDLASIQDKNTPIMVATHAPLYSNPKLGGNQEIDDNNLQNTGEIEALFADFTNVHFLSGHTHVNYNVQKRNNIREHNTAAICATWWWTGKLSGNNTCTDGTPGGYGVYLWNGNQAEWYYKSSGFDKKYQFRSYDLNTTYIAPEVYAPKYQEDMKIFAQGYDIKKSNNEIMLNIWNYQPDWKIEVTEEGKLLEVNRMEGYDPLHIISYDAKRINAGGKAKVTFPSTPTAHLFKAKASKSNSTINIKVTDNFGHVYTEEMKRPKAFNVNIR